MIVKHPKSKNAVAIAAKHSKAKGHTTWYDMVISGMFRKENKHERS